MSDMVERKYDFRTLAVSDSFDEIGFCIRSDDGEDHFHGLLLAGKATQKAAEESSIMDTYLRLDPALVKIVFFDPVSAMGIQWLELNMQKILSAMAQAAIDSYLSSMTNNN